MGFIISDAIAATTSAAAAPGQMDSMASMLMMAGIFVVMYLLERNFINGCRQMQDVRCVEHM